MKNKRLLFFGLLLFFAANISAQNISKQALADTITAFASRYANVGKISVKSMKIVGNTFQITTDNKLSFIPFRPENVKELKNSVRKAAFGTKSNIVVDIKTAGLHIEDLIPNAYRAENQRKNRYALPTYTPLVTNKSVPYSTAAGLQNKHIALWGSHGYYFDQTLDRWKWQRPRLFETLEDMYTSSYVQPFLVPMLENAGAYILQPRERDTQTHEIIVDNDDEKSQNGYFAIENHEKDWKYSSDDGFRHTKATYIEGENPFKMGTYRYSKAETEKEKMSCVRWIPNIPESGEYAVYIAYKSLPQSVSDAHYTVNHSGGSTHFSVNQQMGGGTWIYLGTFRFDKGKYQHQGVQLCNISQQTQGIITADAVKFGGGMGNIARKPAQNTDSIYSYKTSGYPRFREGARYWLQWAGIPDSVYSFTQGENDYIDDFSCRGRWINYLTGGSSAYPNQVGLKIPIQLGLGFHSDTGITYSDSIVGTLVIFSSTNDEKQKSFSNGVSRYNTRDLADMIQSQIVEDVRLQLAPEWQRRAIWNKSYSETRNPEVPTVLLELLSHQNFADMRYGNDPRFKFCVSRAIYKAILKYVHLQYATQYVVQPLPVNSFAINFQGKDSLKLSWQATIDSLESTANPDYYIVYTQTDSSGFDNGIRVNQNYCILPIEPNKQYNFRIAAGNAGGISFPSETLSACRVFNEKGKALIINNFTRIAPANSFAYDSVYAGFIPRKYAVAYGNDFSFVGEQYEFKRDAPWVDNDAPGFGASYATYENQLTAGNTFNYPQIHGRAIAQAGYSYVSSSVLSIDSTQIDKTYAFVDVIAGKQKQTQQGRQKKHIDFQVFPNNLQMALTHYAKQGGNILVSGAYIASDIWEGPLSTESDKNFAENILHFTFRTNCASLCGQVKTVDNRSPLLKKEQLFTYFTTPNATLYMTEEPDGIEPADDNSTSILQFADNQISAAIAHQGTWKTCVFGFPLECLQKETDLAYIMQEIAIFFQQK